MDRVIDLKEKRMLKRAICKPTIHMLSVNKLWRRVMNSAESVVT